MHSSRLKWLLTVLAAIVFIAGIAAARQTRRVDQSALKNAEKGTEWLTYGHGYSEQRYSTLKQIDTTNVSRLGLAWSFEVGDGRRTAGSNAAVRKRRPLRHHELEHRVAVDARTGKEIWRYDPKADRDGERSSLLRREQPRHRVV